jgi:hypothetical protein
VQAVLASSPGLHSVQRTSTRGSAASQLALTVYAVGLIQGTWYPWSDWRSLGVPLLGFLFEPIRNVEFFDVALNLLAYLPLGILAVWALWPSSRRISVLLALVIAISALSLLLETGQTFLPRRIPSNLDWLCNSVGGLLGVVIGRTSAAAVLEFGWPHGLRERYLSSDAGTALVLIALWLFAQLHPQPLLLATGEIVKSSIHWLWPSMPRLSTLLGYQLSSDKFIGIEAIALALAVGSIAVIVLQALRAPAVRAAWVIGAIVGLALLAKSASAYVLLGADQAFGWASAGAQAGLVIAGLWVYALRSLSPLTRLILGLLTVATEIVLINIAPENAYYQAMIERIDPGRWTNLVGLSAFAASIWPFIVIAYLVLKIRRGLRG